MTIWMAYVAAQARGTAASEEAWRSEQVSKEQEEPPATESGLTMPRQLWCPRCKLHNRSQDAYGQSDLKAPTTLKDFCPICQDEIDRGAPIELPE